MVTSSGQIGQRNSSSGILKRVVMNSKLMILNHNKKLMKNSP